jgi:hypothetical protein
MQMSSQTEAFFKQYASAFNQGCSKSLVQLFQTPSVIMSDDAKTVFTSGQEIAFAFEALMIKFKQAGISTHLPKISQIIRLSDTIVFVNVVWQMLDVAEKIVFSCSSSYTLQEVDKELKIIVSVIDDGDKALASLLHD